MTGVIHATTDLRVGRLREAPDSDASPCVRFRAPMSVRRAWTLGGRLGALIRRCSVGLEMQNNAGSVAMIGHQALSTGFGRFEN